MLTDKSFQGLLRVAAQKMVDGLPNEDDFVVRKLQYQRGELMGLIDAYGVDPKDAEEVAALAADIKSIDHALSAYSVPAAVSLNPFERASEIEIEGLLRALCAFGLSPSEAAELDDQIEALVPAVVELRDGGHLALNVRVLSELGQLEGFMTLAEDERLTDLSRRRCAAIRDRMIVLGVKAIFGISGN